VDVRVYLHFLLHQPNEHRLCFSMLDSIGSSSLPSNATMWSVGLAWEQSKSRANNCTCFFGGHALESVRRHLCLASLGVHVVLAESISANHGGTSEEEELLAACLVAERRRDQF
jgi:hypothetical protein